ncbi:MAG TPA: glycosyltransferase family 2 protein [Phycisphaerales bacterium]|nr:glycosyltransferase family 2 protein [Phycisphaerales bacterium]
MGSESDQSQGLQQEGEGVAPERNGDVHAGIVRTGPQIPGVRRPITEIEIDARRVSIVVPTFREAENIPHLIARIEPLRQQGLVVEVVIVDDNSPDNTEQVVASLNKPWVRLVIRTRDRGLSQSVLEGIRQARYDNIIVMDADLSHPPEAIPAMVEALEDGADMVFGSRYVPGGTTAEDWGAFRWLNSKVATLLARPFTSIKDPMAGFFSLTRAQFERADQLNAVGFKIGLELIVKCRCRDVREVPIHFANRKFGESKLSLKEQVKYIRHLRLLAMHKFPVLASLTQFLAVGLSGTVVNLAVLTLLLWMGLMTEVALAAAILISMTSNFVLNRRFSFSYARDGSLHRQYVSFVAVCSLGALINYVTAIAMIWQWPELMPQLAALVGIAVGTAFNYVLSYYAVFRRK